jgi:hypothetical protein
MECRLTGRRLIERGPDDDRWLILEGLRGYGAGPAHPGDRGLRMVAELLRHPRGTATRPERADRRGGGPPDLPGAGMLTALQRRHEHRIGPCDADAELVCHWSHR